MITVGIDPDSNKHGVAIYNNGKLEDLKMMSLMDIAVYVEEIVAQAIFDGTDQGITFSIEDVMSNKFVYARNNHGNKSVTSKIAMAVGRCQQAQAELMRLLDYLDIAYVLHKPQKGNWDKNKAQFEKITGWDKQSNEDKRSAAFMGWLALK